MTCGYNRKVRTVCLALVMLSLAACHRGLENNKEAVRQGVIDYLTAKKFNVPGMSVDVTSVKFDGNHADAVVTITPKGGPAGAGMSMPYKLEQKDGKWAVVASSGTHPGAVMPDAAAPDMSNPHGGGAMPPAAGANPAMPSPNDLPPVKKK
jgi:hypothetical protein